MKKIGYMCATDFHCHLENDIKGVKIYPTEAEIRTAKKCVDECGLIKVQVEILETLVKGIW